MHPTLSVRFRGRIRHSEEPYCSIIRDVLRIQIVCYNRVNNATSLLIPVDNSKMKHACNAGSLINGKSSLTKYMCLMNVASWWHVKWSLNVSCATPMMSWMRSMCIQAVRDSTVAVTIWPEKPHDQWRDGLHSLAANELSAAAVQELAVLMLLLKYLRITVSSHALRVPLFRQSYATSSIWKWRVWQQRRSWLWTKLPTKHTTNRVSRF